MAGNPNGQLTAAGPAYSHSDAKGPCSWCKQDPGDVTCSEQCKHERAAAEARGWLRPLVRCEREGTANLLAAFWEQRADSLRRHRRVELQFLLSDQFAVWCDLDGYGRVEGRRARFLSMWEVRWGDEDLLWRAACSGCGTTNAMDFWFGEDEEERTYCKECERERKRVTKERR